MIFIMDWIESYDCTWKYSHFLNVSYLNTEKCKNRFSLCKFGVGIDYALIFRFSTNHARPQRSEGRRQRCRELHVQGFGQSGTGSDLEKRRKGHQRKSTASYDNEHAARIRSPYWHGQTTRRWNHRMCCWQQHRRGSGVSNAGGLSRGPQWATNLSVY